MIDDETFCMIRDEHEQQGLNAEKIARSLGLDRRKAAKWLAEPRFSQRQSSVRESKLDCKYSVCQFPVKSNCHLLEEASIDLLKP